MKSAILFWTFIFTGLWPLAILQMIFEVATYERPRYYKKHEPRKTLEQ